jgi:hypothetical protein
LGNYQNAEIVVKKYHDLNANGTQDPGEEFISGWEFTVDGTSKTITDANAGVTFSVKPGQSYDVIEVPQANWVNTDPGDGTFTKTTAVLTSQGSDTLIFGNYTQDVQSSISVNDITIDEVVRDELTGVVFSYSGTITITDESNSGSEPDGHIVFLDPTVTQIDWQYNFKGGFQPYYPEGVDGGSFEAKFPTANQNLVEYSTTYTIFKTDDKVDGTPFNSHAPFDEEIILGYTTTVESGTFPDKGSLKGHVEAGITFRPGQLFPYAESFDLPL